MADTIAARLKELGITVPEAPSPVANYVPYAVTGNLVFIAGQGTFSNGKLCHLGKVGSTVSIEDGYQAARLCGLNLLSHLNAACGGDLDRVRRVVKLGGFVNCGPDFTDHPRVVNGASDLFAEIFGDAGRHARFAVGAPSLPGGISVEVDGVFEIS